MGLYLYGFVTAAPAGSITLAGLDRERLRSVSCGRGLIAIVGDIPSRPGVTVKAIKAHDAAVRRIARHVEGILPARFGIYQTTLAGLREAIGPRATDLRSALARVAGREQMTLRLTDSEPMVEQTAASPTGRGPKQLGSRTGAGTRHLIDRAANLRGQAAAPELDPIRAALGALVAEERVRRGRPPLVLTAYHLIDRRAARMYRRLVRQSAVAPRFAVRITGPFPPYGFAPAWIE